jgi:hypothetical protein
MFVLTIPAAARGDVGLSFGGGSDVRDTRVGCPSAARSAPAPPGQTPVGSTPVSGGGCSRSPWAGRWTKVH